MNSDLPDSGQQPGHLSLWDTVSIIIGIVIGAGIYETAPLVFTNVPGPAVGLMVWVAGGLLSLVGALCYAELATTFPRSGGDYVYLTQAYGRLAGYLFGWCQLTVLMTGSIGMMAYIFADYSARLWHISPAWKPALAAAAVFSFTLTNVLGVVAGKRAQNLLTWTKILGIGGILAAGFLWSRPLLSPTVPIAPAANGSIGLAMILVLYTYGGWNDAALVTAEVQDRRRNIPRALVLGTLSLTLIYLLVNGAYLAGLGFDKARGSREIATDLMQSRLGTGGAAAITLLVMISALGAINGLVYTGSRVYASLGADFRWFAGLAKWHPKRRTPIISLLSQGTITILLVLLVGTEVGRAALSGILGLIGIEAIQWQGHGGFDTLLRCTAPVFWLFFLATGLSLFVLRWRNPDQPRPFRVPLYPWVPALFCAVCLYMLYSATVYAARLVFVGLLPLALGLITYLMGGRSASIVPATSKIKTGEDCMKITRPLICAAIASVALTASGADLSPGNHSTDAAVKTVETPRKKPDVIYIPTPQEAVDQMLEAAEIKKGDVVYDLGCGDGRIVVTAAKKYGVKATGFDIDPERIAESRENVRTNGLANLVTIEEKDIFTVDLSKADVVTLYLLPSLNVKLIPQLEKMKPGSRIVSHSFDMAGIKPDRVIRNNGTIIYKWSTPLTRETSKSPETR